MHNSVPDKNILTLITAETCPMLQPPVDGSISYSGGLVAMGFGATATYVCNSSELGLSGGNRVRSCGPGSEAGVGQWSGEAPACECKP